MTAEEEEATDRLLFHLENQTGFWFGLVVGDDPAPRARMCDAAASFCMEHHRPFFLHATQPSELVATVVALAGGTQPGIHWIRADGLESLQEAWNAGVAQMFMAMNERREAYRKRFNGGIIVEGRSALKRILREMAPDMFSVRAFIAEPGADPRDTTDEIPEWRAPMLSTWKAPEYILDANQALERLTHIARSGRAEDIEVEFFAILSLAKSERYDEAEKVAQEALLQLQQLRHEDPDWADLLEVPIRGVLGDVIYARRNSDCPDALVHWDNAIELARSSFARISYATPDLAFGVAKIIRNKAHALVGLGDILAAKDAYEREIELLTEWRSSLPPEGDLSLVDAYRSLGYCLLDEKVADVENAVVNFQKALAFAQATGVHYPDDDRWRLEILRGTVALSYALVQKRDFQAAVASFLSAGPLAESLERHGTTSALGRNVLDEYYKILAVLLMREKEYDARTDQLRQRAISNLRVQAAREPEDANLSWLLARVLWSRAILVEVGDSASAKVSAREALDLIGRLSVQGAEDSDLKQKIEALRAFVESGPKPF